MLEGLHYPWAGPLGLGLFGVCWSLFLVSWVCREDD